MGRTHRNQCPTDQPIESGFENALSQHGNQVTYKGELVLHADTEDGQGIIYYTEDGSDPTSASSVKSSTQAIRLTIKGNRKVKLVVADEKGNYSAVKPSMPLMNWKNTRSSARRRRAHLMKRSPLYSLRPKMPPRPLSSSLSRTAKIRSLSSDELRQAIQDALDELKSNIEEHCHAILLPQRNSLF